MRRPPRLASWLIAHFASSYQREALIGDLFEEYQRGRRPLWYWRQAGLAVGWAVMKLLPGVSLLHRLTKRLLAILAVTVLGIGTLTWAATTYAPSCAPRASSCHNAH